MKVSKVYCPKCYEQQPIVGSYYRHNLTCKSCGSKENTTNYKIFMRASEHTLIDDNNEILLNEQNQNWSLRFNKSSRDEVNSISKIGAFMVLIPSGIIALILSKEGISLTQNVILGIPVMLFVIILGLSITVLIVFGKAQISVYEGLFEIFFGIGRFGIRQQIIWSRIKSAEIIPIPTEKDDGTKIVVVGKQNQLRFNLKDSDTPTHDFSTSFDPSADQFLVEFINQKIQNN